MRQLSPKEFDLLLYLAERDVQSVAAALAVVGTYEGITPDLAEAILKAFDNPDDLSAIFVSGRVVGAPIRSTENIGQARRGAAFTAKTDGGAEVLVPVLTADAPIQGDAVVVRAFVSDQDLSEGVVVAWAMLMGLGVFLIVVAVLAADGLGRSVVRPVTKLSEAAHEWGRGNLEARVEPAGPAEIAEVGEAFNTLAGCLDELDREIGNLIQRARRQPSDARVSEAVDLGDVVIHRASFWQVLANEQGRPTTISIEPGEHLVALPMADLGALIDVLIENVFAHTVAGVGYDSPSVHREMAPVCSLSRMRGRDLRTLEQSRGARAAPVRPASASTSLFVQRNGSVVVSGSARLPTVAEKSRSSSAP